MRLHDCINIADLRVLAKKRLPAPMFHYLDGGADDEWSLQHNTKAFEKYQLLPRYLRDISKIDTTTNVLSSKLDLPFFLSPTGMSRLFHHDKELAASRAASKAGTLYSLSTLATTSLEEVAQESFGPKMYQMYILKDRALTESMVQRAKEAGYSALCLTVDTQVAGNRERDIRNGMTIPPSFSPKNLLSFVFHPGWTLRYLTHPGFRLENVAGHVDALKSGALGVIDYVNSQYDRTLTWKDATWLRSLWEGPFVIKGLQTPDDALRARDIGATAIMVSNHGGRQLESAPAPVDCIKAMRKAIGRDLELIMDGGIRRGSHIVKALAMGADACSVGRAYLYGLAAGGEAGVSRAISILKSETERTMALMGATSLKDLTLESLQMLEE